jgi:hypothetical protein
VAAGVANADAVQNHLNNVIAAKANDIVQQINRLFGADETAAAVKPAVVGDNHEHVYQEEENFLA